MKGHLATAPQDVQTKRQIFVNRPGPCETLSIVLGLLHKGILYNGYRVFPGGKERPERAADPSPPSSAVVKKG
jgi:hypothetical protein